jgi:hypothetical protein
MLVCFDLVKQGKAQAVVSAGNSGAMLACGLLKFGRLKGIDRPAISASVPRWRGQCVLLDVGANVECKPINLVQFAVLGAIFARTSHGVARPRVGVLSNGSEEGKGTELTRAAHRALAAHPSADFSYVGYVEGKDIFKDERRRRRHRRLHRQRRPQGARGDRGLLRQAAARRDRPSARSARSAPCSCAPRSPSSRSASTPTPTAARRCSASTAWRSSATAAPARPPCYNGIRLAGQFAARDLTPALRTAVAAHKDLFAAAKREEGAA